MDSNDVMSIIKDNPRFFLATCEGRQPRVRVISLLQADDDGIVFVTGKHKDVYRQICDNPLVELLFWVRKSWCRSG